VLKKGCLAYDLHEAGWPDWGIGVMFIISYDLLFIFNVFGILKRVVTYSWRCVAVNHVDLARQIIKR
jgi:hypothetical protein